MEFLNNNELKALIELISNSLTIKQGQGIYDKLVKEYSRRIEEEKNEEYKKKKEEREALKEEILKELEESKNGEPKDKN
jgi:DNA recombination-dependent growth factor C